MSDHEKTLLEVLTSLDSQLKKQASLKFMFIKGLIYGLGTVIGATVLIAVISSLLIQFGLEGVLEYIRQQSITP